MAKGLRSKSMRKNRTLLRKLVHIPLIKEKQDNLALKLKMSLDEQNGSTILGLKRKIGIQSSKNSINDNAENNSETEDKMENEDISVKRPRIKFNKGSKAKKNPGKELVWFK